MSPAGGGPLWAASERMLVLLVGVPAAVIVALTLSPAAAAPGGGAEAGCALCGSPLTADAVVNFLLFLPLGVGLALMDVRLGVAVAASFAFSAAIEGLQFVAPGRYPTLSDLALNTAGGAAGVLLARATLLSPSWRPARARRAAVAWGVVVAAIIAATGWLSAPWPPSSVYYGQWTPSLGHLDAYGGTVRSADIGAIPLPDGRLADPEAVRRAIRAGAAVAVRYDAGPRTAGLAPILSIFDDARREIFLLGVAGRDVVARRATRARALGFRNPEAVLRVGAGARPGSKHTLRVEGTPRGTCIAVDGEGRCGLGPNPGSGWALLLPGDRLRSWPASLAGAIWLAVIAAPLGALGGASPHTAIGWGIAVLAGLAAPLFGLASAPLVVMLGLTAGVVGPVLGVRTLDLARRATDPSAAPTQVESKSHSLNLRRAV